MRRVSHWFVVLAAVVGLLQIAAWAAERRADGQEPAVHALVGFQAGHNSYELREGPLRQGIGRGRLLRWRTRQRLDLQAARGDAETRRRADDDL